MPKYFHAVPSTVAYPKSKAAGKSVGGLAQGENTAEGVKVSYTITCTLPPNLWNANTITGQREDA